MKQRLGALAHDLFAAVRSITRPRVVEPDTAIWSMDFGSPEHQITRKVITTTDGNGSWSMVLPGASASYTFTDPGASASLSGTYHRGYQSRLPFCERRPRPRLFILDDLETGDTGNKGNTDHRHTDVSADPGTAYQHEMVDHGAGAFYGAGSGEPDDLPVEPDEEAALLARLGLSYGELAALRDELYEEDRARFLARAQRGRNKAECGFGRW